MVIATAAYYYLLKAITFTLPRRRYAFRRLPCYATTYAAAP